jgi:hypothetical protein
MTKQRNANSGSFRVPNSIVQGLTTNTHADLNRLSAFQMAVLLGLMAHIDQNAPEQEVQLSLSAILEIVELSKQVAHSVERTWTNEDGGSQEKRYTSKRYSPYHASAVHEALLALFEQTVIVKRMDKGKQGSISRQVHILDSFGYCYEHHGETLDPHQLPPECEKVNVGSDERPVYKLYKRTGKEKTTPENPKGIVFRLNMELAREFAGEAGTLRFTLVAKKIFSLLKQYMRRPAAFRLVILIIRQTAEEFSRNLVTVLGELGFDVTHRSRAVAQLTKVLIELQQLRLIGDFNVNECENKLKIGRNKAWYQEASTAT